MRRLQHKDLYKMAGRLLCEEEFDDLELGLAIVDRVARRGQLSNPLYSRLFESSQRVFCP